MSLKELTEKLELELQPFFNEMVNELVRHYPKNGDSWKTCDIKWLKTLLDGSMCRWFDAPENVSHLLDVANFCAFYYLRYYESTKSDSLRRDHCE